MSDGATRGEEESSDGFVLTKKVDAGKYYGLCQVNKAAREQISKRVRRGSERRGEKRTDHTFCKEKRPLKPRCIHTSVILWPEAKYRLRGHQLYSYHSLQQTVSATVALFSDLFAPSPPKS